MKSDQDGSCPQEAFQILLRLVCCYHHQVYMWVKAFHLVYEYRCEMIISTKCNSMISRMSVEQKIGKSLEWTTLGSYSEFQIRFQMGCLHNYHGFGSWFWCWFYLMIKLSLKASQTWLTPCWPAAQINYSVMWLISCAPETISLFHNWFLSLSTAFQTLPSYKQGKVLLT